MIMLWTNFSWDKIYTRILLIQKKIFKATKEYNKNKIYKLQKYLLNSNEVKLLSIDHIVKSIEAYYGNNKNITIINNQQKLYLVKLLFYPYLYSSSNLYFIIQQIHKYIIYLCIKPEWEAKLDFKFKQAFNFYLYMILKIKYIQNISIYNYLSFRNEKMNYNFIDNKFININYIINKMQSFEYLNTCLKYWLINDHFINSIKKDFKNNTYKILYKINYLSNSLSSLQHLLYKINIIGYFWYLTYHDKLNNISNHININQSNISNYFILFNHNLSIIDEIGLYIKMQFWKKSQLSNIKTLLQQIVKIVKLYYSDYLSYINCINIYDIDLLYSLINIKIFYSIKKYNSICINNYSLYNINKSLNNFLYILKYMNYFKYG